MFRNLILTLAAGLFLLPGIWAFTSPPIQAVEVNNPPAFLPTPTPTPTPSPTASPTPTESPMPSPSPSPTMTP